jgi:hypothetical protein
MRRTSSRPVLKAGGEERSSSPSSQNRLHWPRDVILREDACRVRTGHAPQVLAAASNCVVGLLHRRNVPNLAATVHTCAWSLAMAVLGLLGLAPS